MAERLVRGLTWLALGAIATMAVAPGGILATRLMEWHQSKVEAQRVEAMWASLSDGMNRTGGGSIELVVFSDFQCPYCRQFYLELERFSRARPGVGVVHRNLPLTSLHPAALDAARAATCAGIQGRFRAVYRVLYEHDSWMETRDWAGVAHQAGIGDAASFVDCVHRGFTDSLVRADLQLADSLRLTGTPSVILPDRVVAGAVNADWLIDQVR